MPDAESASGGLKVERSFRGKSAFFRLEGELSAREAAGLARDMKSAFQGVVEEVVVNMEECDLEGAEAVSAFVSAVKGLLGRGSRVALYGPPQMLAHNLYRAGLTKRGKALRLIAQRKDEPTAS